MDYYFKLINVNIFGVWIKLFYLDVEYNDKVGLDICKLGKKNIIIML